MADFKKGWEYLKEHNGFFPYQDNNGEYWIEYCNDDRLTKEEYECFNECLIKCKTPDSINKIIKDFKEFNYHRYLVKDNYIIFSTMKETDVNFWDTSKYHCVYLEIGYNWCNKYTLWNEGDDYADMNLYCSIKESEDINKHEFELIQRFWELVEKEKIEVLLKKVK